MIMAAISDALAGDWLRRYFARGTIEHAIRLILPGEGSAGGKGLAGAED
jgi:hypothetical protein